MRNLVRNTILVAVVIIIAVYSIIPPSKTIRLGKDLRGGFNVVYQVDVGGDSQNRDDVMDKVVQVVKDRLDPNGLLDISIVKSGSDRIEITMPLPGEESKRLKAAFEAEIDKLVTRAMDRPALNRIVVLPTEQRESEFDRLAGGDAKRLGLLRAAADAYDALKAANDAYDAAAQRLTDLRKSLEEAKAKEQPDAAYITLLEQGLKGEELAALPLADAANAAENEYDARANAALSTVISRDEVEHALNRRDTVVRVPNPDNPSAPLILPSPRAVAISNLVAAHPEAADQIKAVAESWKQIESNVKINDPNDLIRLLEGSGVLNFRITVQIGELGTQERELRDQLHKVGPHNARSEQARWFKINKIENWFESKAEYDQLQSDPAAYLAGRQGLVGEEFDGEYYILCWDKKGLRLTERDGPKWQLKAAYQGQDRIGRPAIHFEMDSVGSGLMGELTGSNVGREMAVVLDDEVYTAPRINSQINGSGLIEGNFTSAEINYIIKVLSHGSLAAKLSKKPISQDIIAPDKGLDNLQRGLKSGVIAFIVCACFMIVYYFGCGLVSVIALLLNALLVVAVMVIQGAPFTLPGIAGLVLVFGMAIDANVLIYERMREELLNGHDLKTAVRLGYEKALSSIVDGNLTTLIICIVLGFTGTQEIKGFGITLGIGNVMTLFTQLFVTRIIFGWAVERTGLWRKARMLPLVIPALERALSPNLDWMKLRWVFATFSILVTGACVTLIAVRGSEMLDTQFRGGTKVTVLLKETSPGGERVKKTREEIQAEFDKAAALAEPDSIIPQLARAAVVLKNPDPANPLLSSEFQFKTTMVDAGAVQKAIIQVLRPVLDAQPELKFKDSDATDPRAAPVYPIVDASLGKNIGRPEVTDKVIDYIGGAAIVLENIDPPVSLESIGTRLRQFRSQPDFLEAAGRQQSVIKLAGSDSAVTAAVILVKDSAISTFEGNDRKWADKLRDVEWRLAQKALTQTTTLASVESFSSEIAATFRAGAIIAVMLSTVLVIIYVWVRFGSFRYSMAAIITTLHDCLVAVGVIAFAEVLNEVAPGVAGFLGIMPFKMDLNIVAAVLTILGYSLNDTIIVMDRIRETKGKLSYANRRIINESINKTVSRTVITSGTTFFACMVLYLFGGEAVHGFAYSMLAGILIGTYSSIAIAAPLVWSEQHEKPAYHGPGHAPKPA